LPPGGRVVVARDRAAFMAAYGTNRPLAGVFTNDTALSNGGELIKLDDAENGTVREFTYDDGAPWPAETDGTGYSLVLVAPESNPDHDVPTNWRKGARLGGSPGAAETTGGYPADPLGDANGNGEPDLIDYALGHDLGGPEISPTFALQPGSAGEPAGLRLSYPMSLSAERVEIGVQFSTDLEDWEEGAPHLEAVSTAETGDGRALVTWEVKAPLRSAPRLFMRLRVTEP
jgi:hypothetical protein